MFKRFIELVTGHERETIVPEWSSRSITHNLFRKWEVLAGRKAGIRAEVSMSKYDGKITRKFYTIEARIAHIEGTIRTFLRFELNPRFKTWNHALQYGAITFGGDSNNGNITPSGSNRMLVGGIFNINNDFGTVQFDSVTCNQIDTSTLSANRIGRIYMLKAPNASTTTFTGAGAANWNIYFYTGVTQNDTAGTVDNHGVTTGTGTAISGSLTPVAANSFIFASLFIDNQTASRSGATNLNNLLQQSGGAASSASVDSGDSGAVSGATAQSETGSASGAWAVLQVSMSPLTAGPANVKTYDGLASASTKTVLNGLAIASVKTWNGIT